jgi:hypothetical protein
MRHTQRQGHHGQLHLPASLLHLTLDDVLLQHEKMLALLRRLASQLAQELDAMGRRLDGLMRHQLEVDGIFLEDEASRGEDSEEYRLQECVELFAACARELHRKQGLAQALFLSTNDEILYAKTGSDDDFGADDGNGSDAPGAGAGECGIEDPTIQGIFPASGAPAALLSSRVTPRSIARACARAWSRESPESELWVYRGLIERTVAASSGGAAAATTTER